MSVQKWITVFSITASVFIFSFTIYGGEIIQNDQAVIDKLYQEVPELATYSQWLKENTYSPILKDYVIQRPNSSQKNYEVAIASNAEDEIGKAYNWVISKDFKTIRVKRPENTNQLQHLEQFKKEEKERIKKLKKNEQLVQQTRQKIRVSAVQLFQNQLSKKTIVSKQAWKEWIYNFVPELHTYIEDYKFFYKKERNIIKYEPYIRSVQAPDKKSADKLNRTHYRVVYAENIVYSYAGKSPTKKVYSRLNQVIFYISPSLKETDIWVSGLETNPRTFISFHLWTIKMQEIHQMNLKFRSLK